MKSKLKKVYVCPSICNATPFILMVELIWIQVNSYNRWKYLISSTRKYRDIIKKAKYY